MTDVMPTTTSSRPRSTRRAPSPAAPDAWAVAVGSPAAGEAGRSRPDPTAAPVAQAEQAEQAEQADQTDEDDRADGAAAPAAAPASHGGWRETPVPVAKGDLTAVAALSATRAWAVGYRLTSDEQAEALALRWDGASWRQESTLPRDSFPQALAVRSADDLWAVGATAAHWNGRAWTAHALAPDPGGRVLPDAVATTPDGRAWTVGRAVPRSIASAVPAVQSWDGAAWHRQPLPDVGRGELSGVAVLAPDDVWAAGAVFAPAGGQQTALLLHFDGGRWRRVPAPEAAGGEHRWFGGIAATAPDDVWAVGGSVTRGRERPFAAHWDGRAWTAVATPAVPDGRLRAVGQGGDGTLWAVGGKGAVSVALCWDATRRRWSRAADPAVVVRGASTVPRGGGLWAVGVAERGDLVPVATRLAG
ncbi:hypothetical protein LRS74_29260 [Streptomyces sp. LX-29]|uniref:hypothetical protein n=1 Tax=Streptomyces sp. LX-29 TaxID=2900152 RepID=UPI00240E7488|nr:hypothetical protein [Streptomyces sp. LX-29]WFB10667.1 hypothetical protein LRS74_29260 [Streptomyces sp. LX-29]